MKSILTPLAKNVLLPLGLAIQNKNHGLGTTASIISNEKMEI